MKIGMIGAGKISVSHIEALKSINGITLVGIYDIDFARSKQIANTYSCAPFKEVDRLFDESTAVIIATPNHTHFQYVMEAVHRGKHILCEKPLATTVEEALKMTNFSQDQNLVSIIGFNYRFLEISQKLKSLINEKSLGEILSIRLEFKRSSAILRKEYTWRDDCIGKLSSGALGDLGSHLIDLLYFFFKSEIILSSLRAKIKTNVPTKENKKVYVDDYGVVNGQLNNGVYFNIIVSKSTLPKDAGFIIEVVGNKKEFYYNSNFNNAYFLKSNIEWEFHNIEANKILEDTKGEVFGWVKSFRSQILAWNDCITNKLSTPDLATFRDGLLTQYILENIINSQFHQLQ
jgi:glucose-6-phosphate 3-dehydrogenase